MVSPATLRWRVLPLAVGSGAWNMALDHALALTLGPGEGVLRFYLWQHPTLSLGRNEPALGVWDPLALSGAGVEVVRRPTGGRAVLHHREVTYAVVLPVGALEGPRRSYRSIHRGIVGGLRLLGVDASLQLPGGRVAAPDAGPCFQEPAPGEVVAGGRKLVGSAQARMGSVILQHGSLLLSGRQDEELSPFRTNGAGGGVAGKDKITSGTASVPPQGAVTLEDILGVAPEPEVVVDALLAGWTGVLPGWSDPREGGWGGASPEAMALARELLIRYQSSPWTWYGEIPVHMAVPRSGTRRDAQGA